MLNRRIDKFDFVMVVWLLTAASLQAQNAAPALTTRAQTILAQGASDDNPDTRREVAVALSLIGSKDPSVSLLEPLSQDKDPLVRLAAIESIGERGDRKLTQLVERALDDDVPEVVFAAAKTLFRMKHPEGKRILIAIVEKEAKGESGFFRGKLREVVRRMKTPKSALLFVAQQGVGFIPAPGIRQGFSAVNSMLADPDFSARATALLLLAADNSPEVRLIIDQAFSDEDWSVRAAAIHLAALRRERRWRPQIIPLLDDTRDSSGKSRGS